MFRKYPLRIRRFAYLAPLFLVVLTSANAQTPSPLPEWQYSAGELLRTALDPSQPTWTRMLGISTEYLPRYDGSHNYGYLSSPTFDIRYRDVAFLSTGEGLGVNLVHSKTYRGGVALTYDLGRAERHSAELRGLGDIKPAPELKFFGEYLAFPVMFRADARRAFGGYEGWVGDISVYVPVIGTDSFFVLFGPSVTFADSAYMEHFFGITPAQSQASGRPEFATRAGLKAASLGLDATWLITDEWLINASLGGDRLLRDAAHSPLTEQSKQFALSFTAGYQF